MAARGAARLCSGQGAAAIGLASGTTHERVMRARSPSLQVQSGAPVPRLHLLCRPPGAAARLPRAPRVPAAPGRAPRLMGVLRPDHPPRARHVHCRRGGARRRERALRVGGHRKASTGDATRRVARRIHSTRHRPHRAHSPHKVLHARSEVVAPLPPPPLDPPIFRSASGERLDTRWRSVSRAAPAGAVAIGVRAVR